MDGSPFEIVAEEIDDPQKTQQPDNAALVNTTMWAFDPIHFRIGGLEARKFLLKQFKQRITAF